MEGGGERLGVTSRNNYLCHHYLGLLSSNDFCTVTHHHRPHPLPPPLPPQVSLFFVNYVVIKAFGGYAVELSRASGWLSAAVKRLLTRDWTARDRRRELIGLRSITNPGGFYYGKYFAQQLVVFVIVCRYVRTSTRLSSSVVGLRFYAVCFQQKIGVLQFHTDVVAFVTHIYFHPHYRVTPTATLLWRRL